MHVVHIIARLNEGGPARVLAALVQALRAHDVRCTVLFGACADGEVDRSALVGEAGATMIAVPGLGRRVSLLDDARAGVAIVSHLRRLAADVVHTHTAKAGFLGRIAARMLGLPCLHTYHGHVLSGYFGSGMSAALASLERVLAGVAWHQALTDSQGRDLCERYRVGRRSRWLVLPVPVTPVAAVTTATTATTSRSVPVIGWLGRMVPIKDGRLWLRTVAELRRTHPVEGLMAGTGPEREALIAEAAALNLPVQFPGVLPAGAALGAMDVLLMTSKNEGQPLAAVEAAGAGVPVVAPMVGGLSDLARARMVIPARRNEQALAEACRLALRLPRTRRDAAQQAALALAPDALAARYAGTYAHIVALHAGRKSA